MKKIVILLTSLLLVGFISGCGGSDSTASSGATTASSGATQSGIFTTSFGGASTKTWYTEKTTLGSTTVNTVHYSRNNGTVNIFVGARSGVDVTQSDGILSFTVGFSSGVTTGNIVGDYLQYNDGSNTEDFVRIATPGAQDNPFNINITNASDDGTVVHLEGSISTSVYDSTDHNNSKTITVSFDFDANEL